MGLKLTEAEWMEMYPEDWHLAANINKYPDTHYSIVWSSDRTKFRADPIIRTDSTVFVLNEEHR